MHKKFRYWVKDPIMHDFFRLAHERDLGWIQDNMTRVDHFGSFVITRKMADYLCAHGWLVFCAIAAKHRVALTLDMELIHQPNVVVRVVFGGNGHAIYPNYCCVGGPPADWRRYEAVDTKTNRVIEHAWEVDVAGGWYRVLDTGNTTSDSVLRTRTLYSDSLLIRAKHLVDMRAAGGHSGRAGVDGDDYNVRIGACDSGGL